MKLKLLNSLQVIIFSFSVNLSAQTQAAVTRKMLAQNCVACHGENGKSLNSLWPNLAGQKKDYLSLQLHNFREGHRTNLIMGSLAKTLSDADIEALATYFSELN